MDLTLNLLCHDSSLPLEPLAVLDRLSLELLLFSIDSELKDRLAQWMTRIHFEYLVIVVFINVFGGGVCSLVYVGQFLSMFHGFLDPAHHEVSLWGVADLQKLIVHSFVQISVFFSHLPVEFIWLLGELVVITTSFNGFNNRDSFLSRADIWLFPGLANDGGSWTSVWAHLVVVHNWLVVLLVRHFIFFVFICC